MLIIRNSCNHARDPKPCIHTHTHIRYAHDVRSLLIIDTKSHQVKKKHQSKHHGLPVVDVPPPPKPHEGSGEVVRTHGSKMIDEGGSRTGHVLAHNLGLLERALVALRVEVLADGRSDALQKVPIDEARVFPQHELNGRLVIGNVLQLVSRIGAAAAGVTSKRSPRSLHLPPVLHVGVVQGGLQNPSRGVKRSHVCTVAREESEEPSTQHSESDESGQRGGHEVSREQLVTSMKTGSQDFIAHVSGHEGGEQRGENDTDTPVERG